MGVLHPRAGRAVRRLRARRRRSARRRCRCSTRTTRRGSARWVEGDRAAERRRTTGPRRWPARRSCWSCRPTTPRPARQDFAGASLPVELDEELTAALKTLSQRHGATLYMTLLAGWAAVLARLSGQDDVVVGTPSANRAQRGDRGADRLLRQHAAAARGPVGLAHRGGAAGAGEGAVAGARSSTRTSPSSRWWSGCGRRAAWRTPRSSR